MSFRVTLLKGNMFGGFFGGLAGGTFSGQYRCFPVSFIDKNEAETGNKIFLPSSALDRLGVQQGSKQDIGPSESIWFPAKVCQRCKRIWKI